MNAAAASGLAMPKTLSLAGKTAIVTGASRGIGVEIALELARRGADVAVCHNTSTSAPLAADVVARVRALGRGATAVRAQLEDPGSGEFIVRAALEGLGATKIDIVVNNGATDQEPRLCTELDPDEFDAMMRVNVRGPMLLVKAAVPHMPKEGGGRIISLSSVQARQPQASQALYSASKAALECVARYWAAELGRAHGLTSNVVQVGVVQTDNEYYRDITEAELELLRELPSAARRTGTVDDVAQIVAFLASDSARWINGDTIAGNGGTNYL